MDECSGSDERVGVFIGKCDLELTPLICQPTVSLDLVDCRTGRSLFEKTNSDETVPCPVTQPFYAFQKRTQSPCWDEMLVCCQNFQDICNTKNTNYLFLFEISDTVQAEPASTIFKTRTRGSRELEPGDIFESPTRHMVADEVRMRVAWAFLKPVAANGSLNTGKQLRLQLYKVGRKCSTPHHTCQIYHLYSDHKRKKYPGSLYVEVRGVPPAKPPITLSAPDPPSSKKVPDVADSDESTTVTPRIFVADWSRLPTQSCKLPNKKLTHVPVSQQGASCIAFCHSGTLLACGSFAKLVIVNILECKEVGRLSGHTGLVYDLDWASDDSILLSVSADSSAIIWNVKPLKKTPLFVLPHSSFVYCGKWLQNGRHLVTGGKDSTLRCWAQSDSGFELLEEVRGHDGFISALEICGASLMFSGDSLGVIIMWTMDDDKWVPSRRFSLRETAGVIDAIHLHPGRRRVVVTARMCGSVMLDVAAGVVIHTYQAAYLNARSVTSLSPCGSLLFAFSPKNIINVWELDTAHLIATYDSVFPYDGFSQTALSGYITYHPLEHLAAFALFGCNYPVVLLHFDHHSDHADKLGLTLLSFGKMTDHEPSGPSIDLSVQKSEAVLKSKIEDDHSTEDKLAAIVRNIDRVLAAKRELSSRVNNLSALNREKFRNS